MGCPTTNNPLGLFCPTNQRRFAETGKEVSGYIKHTSTGSTVMTGPSGTVELFRRGRTAIIDWSEHYKTSCISCQGGSNVNIQYLHVESYTDGPVYTCHMKEQQHITNNDILFLDLRHDILVRKETVYNFDKDVTSDEQVLWNQYGVTFPLHKIVPGDLDLTVTETIFVNNDVIDTRQYPMISEISYAFAFPVFGGTPQNNTEEDYYLWAEHYYEDGGYDIYYPEWLRGISLNSAEVDMTNRDIHRYLAIDHITHNEAITLSANTVATPTAITGSWAVSPIKDRAGKNLSAYTTQKLTDGLFTNYVYPQPEQLDGETIDEATNRLLGNPTESIIPIAPL